jgi:ATP-dependent helicase/nuclease subunit A
VLLTAVEEAGWDLRLLSGGNVGRNAFANVLKFARQAEEFEASEGGGPAAFAADLDARERLGDTEAPASLADDGSPAVRIMSIHASKGLEFPIVCVPELAWQPRGGHSCVRTHPATSGGLALAISIPSSDDGEGRPGSTWMERFSAADSAADEQESARVLYVAFTRAQEALIVSGAMGLRPKHPPRAKHHLARLARSLGVRIPIEGPRDVCIRVPRADTNYRLRILDASEVDASTQDRVEPGQEGLPRIAPPAGPVFAERSRLPGVRPSARRLSYTQLEEFERCPKRFWVRRVLGVRPAEVPETSGGDPRRFGIALHTALRLVTDDGCAPVPERLEAIAAQAGLTEDETERLASIVRRYCASDLARAETQGAVVRRETPFFVRMADGFSLAGSIDLYARTGNSAVVVDYKSGNQDESTDWEQRYRLQAVCYALAVMRDGCDEVRVEFVRIEGETSDGGIPKATYTFSAVDARAIEDELLTRHAEITESAFEPHPSHECQRCDVPEGVCEHRRPGTPASGA